MLQGFSDGTKLSGRFTSEFWQYVWEIQLLLLPIFLWEDLQISERLWKEYPAGSKAGNDSWASLVSVLPYCISLCQRGSQLYSLLFWLHEDVNEQISHYMAQLGWKQMLLVCFFADVACVLFCVGHDLQRVICESLFSPETPNIWTHSRKWFHLNFRLWLSESQKSLKKVSSCGAPLISQLSPRSKHWKSKWLHVCYGVLFYILSTFTPAN